MTSIQQKRDNTGITISVSVKPTEVWSLALQAKAKDYHMAITRWDAGSKRGLTEQGFIFEAVVMTEGVN